MIKRVVKRDGSTQKFQLKKITHSLQRAMRRSKAKGDAEAIAKEVYSKLRGPRVSSEQIRNAVNVVLEKNKMKKVYDSYSLMWLYRQPVKIKSIIKRHGGHEKFNPEKLFKSIHKAMRAARIHNDKLCQQITTESIKRIEKDYKNRTIDTNEIREAVTYVLTKRRLNSVARFYILHRYL